MSLTRDPEAPSSIQPTKKQLNSIQKYIQRLGGQRAQLGAGIVAEFGSIKAATGMELHGKYCTTLADLRSRKQQVRRLTLDKGRVILNTVEDDV